MTPRMAVALLATAVGAPALAADGPARYLGKPDSWFASEEGKRVADNVLSHQADAGGWPKNIDTTARPYAGDRKDLKPTFDNAATTDEIRLLARAFAATNDDRYRSAVERGVDYILKAQYSNGGWPQFHPPPATTYHRHITLNDGAMVRLMQLCREVAESDRFRFLGDDRRKAARTAFDKGVDCLLKCQIKVEDKLTVWCAQHDEKDSRPRPGRTFELASLSGAESVGVVELLMSLDKPSPEIVRAVEGAVAWFDAAKQTGIRQMTVDDTKGPRGRNKVIVADPAAPPLWARFYEIGTNKPLFADRDGVAKFALADIGYERRNGYAWYGTWPAKLLADEYPAWKKLIAREK
jgi:PelA/Pel-15E family pectate lyase